MLAFRLLICFLLLIVVKIHTYSVSETEKAEKCLSIAVVLLSIGCGFWLWFDEKVMWTNVILFTAAFFISSLWMPIPRETFKRLPRRVMRSIVVPIICVLPLPVIAFAIFPNNWLTLLSCLAIIVTMIEVAWVLYLTWLCGMLEWAFLIPPH